MRARFVPLILAGVAAAFALLDPPRSEAQAGPDDAPAGTEVQARGAVHEAYADAGRAQPVPGPVVPKAPPRRVEEVPPDEKPEGDNIVWIPGYWSWDDEGKDFVWVSGFWRAVPPGRQWMPGSWQESGGGYRWVSGYWAPVGQDETQYQPAPPQPLESGPSTPAPGENYSFVPGIWVYQTTRYAWRPGYWLGFRQGWSWTPACYRWTPVGSVYVPGYWDAPLLERGLLFAPVAFPTAVYLTPGYVYRPAFCVQPDFLCGALFVRRGYSGYYFGDYFGGGYRSSFTAWSGFRFGRGFGVDLNFGYYRNAYRGYPAWERGINGLYAGRFAGTIAAPPRTLVQQRTVINNININKTTNNVVNNNVNITNVQNSTVLSSVRNTNKVRSTALASLAGAEKGAKLPAVTRDFQVARQSPAQLAEEKKQITRVNAIARERRKTETGLVAKAPKGENAEPIKARLTLPKDTPPARLVKTPTPPPPPGKVKAEEKAVVTPPAAKGKVETKPIEKAPPGKPMDKAPPPPVKTAPPPPPPAKPATPPPPPKPADRLPPPRPATPPPPPPPPPPKPVASPPPARPAPPPAKPTPPPTPPGKGGRGARV